MTAHKIFMVRPGYFGFNPETARNNVFQHRASIEQTQLQKLALAEFDTFTDKLRAVGIQVDILPDHPEDQRLDAIFPNNWFSTHREGTLVTYPMYSPIRRNERDPRHILRICSDFRVHCHVAMEHYESEGYFLEGTGSLIIDHDYGVVYANRSPRTSEIPFYRFCQFMGYTPVLFDARDEDGIPVYHTNVVMGIGKNFIIINRSAVSNEDWSILQYYFKITQKVPIEINHEQMKKFLGNVAYLTNANKEPFIILSETAFNALEDHQYDHLSKHGTLLYSNISTIEQIGGGSAKCMIAENFLQRR